MASSRFLETRASSSSNPTPAPAPAPAPAPTELFQQTVFFQLVAQAPDHEKLRCVAYETQLLGAHLELLALSVILRCWRMICRLVPVLEVDLLPVRGTFMVPSMYCFTGYCSRIMLDQGHRSARSEQCTNQPQNPLAA